MTKKPQINPQLLKWLEWSIEVLIYLYLVFMFTKFGAAFRSIGMYGAFSLWLAKVTLSRQIDLPKSPVTYLFLAFLGSATLSTVLSSDLDISLRAPFFHLSLP